MAASYPTSVKSFTTKVNGVDAPDAAHINDLQLEVAAMETELVAGWTDYSAISTVTGWSSFTIKYIGYLRIGKLVFVRFAISGTSNATSAKFTLPFNASFQIYGSALVQDNTGTKVMSFIYLATSGNEVTVYPTPDGSSTGWTNSGTKLVRGEFFFVAS